MNIRKLSKLFLAGVFSASLFSFAGCHGAGLGASVDVESPTVTVDYPGDASVIKDWFYLSGTCKDDKGVTSVKVWLKNSSTDAVFGPFEADVNTKNDTWRIQMNMPAGSDGYRSDGYNVHTYPDGKYTVSVYAYDSAGRVSGEGVRSYVFDNTAPFMIIKSPGIDAANSIPAIGESGKTPSAYGANLKIVGTIVEDNEVSKMLVDIYDTEDVDFRIPYVEGMPYGLRPIGEQLRFNNINIAGGTEEIIASCSMNQSELLQSNYTDIYGDTKDENGKTMTETKNFYCKITLTDSAKVFQDEEGKIITDEQGNTTSNVYINDIISDSLMKDGDGSYGLSAKQIVQIFNDTWEVNGSQQNVNFDYSNEVAIKDVKTRVDDAISKLTAFSLNPDASPKYSVSGYGYNARPDGTEDVEQTDTLVATIDQAINISAKAGRDNWYIKPETLVYYLFGPYDKFDTEEIKEIYNDPKKYAEEHSEEGSDKVVMCTANSNYNGSTLETYNFEVRTPADSIVANKYYVIALTGLDSQGLDMMPEEGKFYIFKGSSNSLPPTVTVKQTTNTYFNSTDVEITGTSSSKIGKNIDKIYWSAVVNDQINTGREWTISDEEPKLVLAEDMIPEIDQNTGLQIPSNVSWRFSLADVSNDADYTAELENGKFYIVNLLVWAEDQDQSESTKVERTFYIDTKQPEFNATDVMIENGNVAKYVGNSNVNYTRRESGEYIYTLRGNVQDIGSGVDSYYYKVVDGVDEAIVNGITRPDVPADKEIPGWTRGTSAFINAEIDVGSAFTKKTIAVFAVDKQGNCSELYTYPIVFDYNSPTSRITAPANNAIINGDVTVEATITEDDIKDVTLYDGTKPLATYSTDSNVTNTLALNGSDGVYSFSFTVPTPGEQTHRFKVVVNDNANGGNTSEEVVATFDKTAPTISITNLPKDAEVYGDEGVYRNNVTKISDGNYRYLLQGRWSDLIADQSEIGSGTATLEYSWDGQNYELCQDAPTGVTTEQSYNVSIKINEGKNQTLYVRATDRAGNTCEPVSVSGILFDCDKPKIEFDRNKLPPVYIKEGGKINVVAVVSDKTTNIDESTITVTAEKVDVKGSGNIAFSKADNTLKITGDGKSRTVEFSFEPTDASTDGVWNFVVDAKDENGHAAASLSTKDITNNNVTIDVTPPILSDIEINSIKPAVFQVADEANKKYFRALALPVLPDASDETSGLKDFYYVVTNKGADESAAVAKGFSSMQMPTPATVTVSGFDDGENKIWVYFTDSAGNETAKKSYTVFVDTKYPTVNIARLSNVKGGAVATETSDKIYVIGNIVEANALDEVLLHTYLDGKELSGSPSGNILSSLAGDKTFDIEVACTDSGYYTFSIDATDKAGNKTVGLKSNGSILFDNTPPELNLSKFNIADGEKIYANGNKFKNSFSGSGDGQRNFQLEGAWKDVGAGTDKLLYSWDNTNWTTETLTSATTEKEFSITIPVTQGKGKTLYLRAEDKAGNLSKVDGVDKPYEITGLTIDYDVPKFENIEYSNYYKSDSSVQKYVNSGSGSLVIELDVTDSYKISNIGITVTATQDGDPVTLPNDSCAIDIANDGVKKVKVKIELENSEANEGEWVFTIKGTDDCGQSASQSTDSFFVDVTPPDLVANTFTLKAGTDDRSYAPSEFENKYFGATTLSITGGDIVESGSQIEKLEYTINGGSEKGLNLNGKSDLKDLSFVGFEEGENDLVVTLYDKAGNSKKVVSATLNVDMEKPKVALTDPTDKEPTASDAKVITSSKEDIYFTATITESNLAEVVFNVARNGVSDTGKSKTIKTFETNDTNGVTVSKTGYVYTITPKFNVSTWNDATYTVSVTAKDKTGDDHNVTCSEKSFLVDRNPPVFTVSNLSSNALVYADETAYKNLVTIADNGDATFNLKGKWSDLDADGKDASGIVKFEYKWDNGDWKEFTEVANALIKKEMSFNVSLPITETSGTARTLYLRATDDAGNPTSAADIENNKISGIKIDFAKPEIEFDNNGLGFDTSSDNVKTSTDGKIIYIKEGGKLDFKAAVKDSYGGLTAAGVTVTVTKKDGASSAASVNKTASADGKTVDVTVSVDAVTAGTNDGEWTIAISASDANARSATPQTSKTAIVDATAPKLSDTFMLIGSEGAVSDFANTYFGVNTLKASGTIDETGSGIYELGYSIKGATERKYILDGKTNLDDVTLTGFDEDENSLVVTLYDKAGNSKVITNTNTSVWIDSINPKLTFNNPTDKVWSDSTKKQISATKDEIYFTVDITEKNLREVDFNISKSDGTATSYSKTITTFETNSGNGVTVDGPTSNKYTITQKFDVSGWAADGDGEYEVTVVAKDRTGEGHNVENSKTFVVDRKAPVIVASEGGYEFNVVNSDKLYADDPDNKGGLFGGKGNDRTFQLEGVWKDAGGVGTKKLWYQWNGTGGEWKEFSESKNNRLLSATDANAFTVTLPVERQGEGQTLYLKASDSVGNEMTTPYAITGLNIDFNKPEVKNIGYAVSKNTLVVDNGQKYLNKDNEKITITADVTDSYKISNSKVTVTATQDGNTPTGAFTQTIAQDTGTDGDKTVKVTITLDATAANEGTWVFTIEGEDVCGQKESLALDSIFVDATSPTLTGFGLKKNQTDADSDAMTNFADDSFGANSLYPVGTIGESGSGFSKIEYYINNAKKNPDLTPTGTTLGDSPLSGFGEGDNTLYLIVYDKAGNTTRLPATDTYTINVDMSPPVVNISDLTDAQENGNVITSASKYVYVKTEIEERNLRYVYINVYKGNVIHANKSVKIDSFAPTSSDDRFISLTGNTYTIIQRFDVTESGKAWDDGTYKIQIFAADKSATVDATATELTGSGTGKSGEKTIIVDKVAPQIVETATSGSDTISFNIISDSTNGVKLYADDTNFKSGFFSGSGSGERKFQLEGVWQDLDGVGTKELSYSWDNTNWTEFSESENKALVSATNPRLFTVQLPVNQGPNQTLYLYAKDNAGNSMLEKSTPYSIEKITIDYDAPVVGDISYALETGEFPESGQKYVNSTNGKLTISTSVTDTYKILASAVEVTATKDGVAADSGYTASITQPLGNEKEVNVTITLTPDSGANEGKWQFTIKGTDGCGREIEKKTEFIIVDVTAPTATGDLKLYKKDEVTNATNDFANKYFGDTTLFVNGGTISDAGGSTLWKLVYKIDAVETTINLTETDTTLNGKKFEGFAEKVGGNNLVLTLYDKAGNTTEILNATVKIDLSAPKVSLSDAKKTSNATDTTEHSKDYVWFTATVEEANLKEVKFNVYKDNAIVGDKSKTIDSFAVTSSDDRVIPAPDGNIYTISQRFDVRTWDDGIYKISVSASDFVDRDTVESTQKSFLVDRTPPVIDGATLNIASGTIYADEGTYKNFVSIDNGKATFSLKGSWSDINGAGTAKLEYNLGNAGWKEFDEAKDLGVKVSKPFNVELPITQTAGTATTLQLRAMDAAENTSDPIEVTGLLFDFEKPVVYIAEDSSKTETSGLGYDMATDTENVKESDRIVYVKSNGDSSNPAKLVLNAKVIDSYGGLSADNVTVTLKKGGSEFTPVTANNISIEKTSNTENSVIAIEVTIPAIPANDGQWTIEIAAKDANNRDAVSKTTSVAIVDATPPVMKDTWWGGSKIHQNDVANEYFNSTSVSISGYTQDVTSDVEFIKYTVIPNENEASKSSGSFNAGAKIAETGSYKNHNTLSSSISGLEPGTNVITLIPVDKAGNEGSGNGYTINVDMSSPMLGEFTNDAGLNLGGQILTNKKSDIVISGTATDDMAIGEIYYTIGTKATAEKIYAEYKTAGSDSANASTVSDLSTGKYKFASYTVTIAAEKLTGKDGEQIMATVKDKAGNTTSQSVGSLIVDETSPTYEITTAKKDLNGETTIRGTSSDNKTPDSFTLYYAKKSVYDGLEKTYTTDTNNDETKDTPDKHGWTKVGDKITNTADIYTWVYENFDWTGNSDAAKNKDPEDSTKFSGKDTIYLLPVIIDRAGNSNAYTIDSVTKKYNWDLTVGENKVTACGVDLSTDKPIVKFENLDSGKILTFGTKATVRGGVTDDDGIVKTFIMASAPITAVVDASGNVTSASADSVAITKGTDSDGNTTWSRNVTVNGVQKTEVTTFNPESGEWSFKPADINDGSKDVYFYIIDRNNTKFNTQGSAQTGLTNNLFYPKVQYNNQTKNQAADIEGVISYNSDSNAPQVNYIKIASGDNEKFTPSAADWQTFSAATAVGGISKRYVKFQIIAYDANGIKSMAFSVSDAVSGEAKTCTFGTSAVKNPNQSSYGLSTWVTNAVDLAGFNTGVTEVNAEPLDNSGMKGGSKMSFYCDNEVDMTGFKVTSPDSTDTQTGNVTIQGIASDGSGAGLPENPVNGDVAWLVPAKGETASSITTNDPRWKGKLVDGRTASGWAFNFNGKDNDAFTSYANANSYNVVDQGNGIFNIPVYFRVRDKLGNMGIYTGYTFQFDPDGDLPKSTITYPTTSDNVNAPTTVGRNIRITGSAEDNTLVKSTYIQLAVTNNTNAPTQWESADLSALSTSDGFGVTTIANITIKNNDKFATTGHYYNVDSNWWGIKVNGTNSWNLTINKNGALGSNKYLWIRACTIDENDNCGHWTSPQMVKIDDSTPVMGNHALKLVTFDEGVAINETNAKTYSQYTEGMYISKSAGRLYLAISAEDDSGISEVSVNETVGGNTGYTITGTVTQIDKNWKALATGTFKDKLLYIPLNTDAPDGNLRYSIYATEATEDKLQGIYNCSFVVDTTAPTMGTLESADVAVTKKKTIDGNKLVNSNGRVNIYSDVTDTGSGFRYIAFNFEKIAATGNKLYNPFPTTMSRSGNDTTITRSVGEKVSPIAVSGLKKDSETGLYGVEQTVTVETDSTLSISADANIRQGGLVKINRKWYLIKTKNGTTLTLNGTFSEQLSSVKAFFPYAIVVETGDSGATRKDNSMGNQQFSKTHELTEEDGDGIMDTVGKNGTTWSWDAYLLSDLIPDGTININLVAFDAAGNFSKQTVSTMIANNAPRLSKVFLATDLNYNENYSGSEFLYYTENNGIEIRNYSFSALNSATGEGQPVVDLDDVGFRVKNTLAVTVEYVGGARTDTISYDALVSDRKITEPRATNETLPTITALSNVETFVYDEDKNFNISKQGLVLGNNFFEAKAVGFENTTAMWEGGTQKVAYLNLALWDEASGRAGAITDTKVDANDETSLFANYGNQNTVVNIPFYLDIEDDQDPVSEIDPMTIENIARVGDSEDGKPLGHVEVGEDLPGEFTVGNGDLEFDRDDKVSGVVYFTGKVSDNFYVNNITVTFGTDSQKQINGIAVATYNTANGTLVVGNDYGSAIYATNGWYFEKYPIEEGSEDTERFSQEKGHEVGWRLVVNTNKFPSVADKDVTLTVAVKDKGDRSQTNSTKQVDIVPYITKIESSGVYYRSMFGGYSVGLGDNLTIHGWNFKAGSTDLWIGTDHIKYGVQSGITNSDTDMHFSATTVGEKSGELVIEVNTTENTRGTGVRTLNDKNGTDPIKHVNNFEEKEADATTDGAKNFAGGKYLDNRYIYVWDKGHSFKSADDNAHKPIMTSDYNGNLFGAWTLMGVGSQHIEKNLTNTSTRVMQHYDQPSEYSAIGIDQHKANGAISSLVINENVGDGGIMTNNGFSQVSNTGGAFGIAIDNDITVNQSYKRTCGYDSKGNAQTLKNDSPKIAGNPFTCLDGNWGTSGYSLASYAMLRDSGKFSTPRAARYDDNMHFVYYNSQTQSLRYTYVKSDSSTAEYVRDGNLTTESWVLIDGKAAGYDRVHDFTSTDGENDLVALDVASATQNSVTLKNNADVSIGNSIALAYKYNNINKIACFDVTNVRGNVITFNGSYEGGTVNPEKVTVYKGAKSSVTNGDTQSTQAGKFASIDVDASDNGKGKPVIVYYDGKNGRLRIAYASKANPSAASDWTRKDVVYKNEKNVNTYATGGQHCALKIDASGNLHIVYRNKQNVLTYIKGTESDGAYTFSAPEEIDDNTTGTFGTISIIKGTQPAVAYLNAEESAEGVKYAIRKEINGHAVWDAMVIPVADGYNPVGDNLICVESNNNHWDATEDGVSMSDVTSAVSYQSTRLDVVFLKNE